MSGTREGGLKAARTNKAKDPAFYAKIGKIGGQRGNTGGFASNKIGVDGKTGPERAASVARANWQVRRLAKDPEAREKFWKCLVQASALRRQESKNIN